MRLPSMPLVKRFVLMAGLWLVLTANDAAAWLPGALAAFAAALLATRLMPPAPETVRMGPALGLLAHFVRGSLVGGIDVARRAFDPRLPVHPGWVRYPLRLARGPRRKLLGDILSLMPGSLAAGEQGHDLLVHCLDTRQPVPRDIAVLEDRLEAVLGSEQPGASGG